MLALCLMLLVTYYNALNYAGIIGWSLVAGTQLQVVIVNTTTAYVVYFVEILIWWFGNVASIAKLKSLSMQVSYDSV